MNRLLVLATSEGTRNRTGGEILALGGTSILLMLLPAYVRYKTNRSLRAESGAKGRSNAQRRSNQDKVRNGVDGSKGRVSELLEEFLVFEDVPLLS